MKRRSMVLGLLVVVGCMLCFGSTFVYAADLSLVGMLTDKLGVTTEQAEGGAGAIFNVASKNMSADNLSKVTDALPDVTSLMKSASSSSSSGASSAIGSLSSMVGSSSDSLSSLASLSSTFSSLGLDSDMVGKFIPIVLEYAQSKGGSQISSLLKSALQ